ncbi:MAG: PorP/SprF family type IX secretion system membrane protein [Saprospiraceae bacterium]|nr:PorP/SprF family type IX secretion system membrane protein [Saprospiraceae bacterium]
MKKFYLLLAFVAFALQMRAQDQAIFTHYHVSPILINPSVAGFDDVHNIQLNFRNQWTGFPGSPFTYAASYHGPIGKTLGVGANVLSENIGSLNRVRLQLNYAFRYQIKDVRLAIGFSTEFSNTSLQNSTTDNPFYEAGDLVLEEYMGGQKVFDATLGFYGNFKDQTFVGLSFPNLIVTKISDIQSSDPEGSFFKYFVFQLGHKFKSPTTNISIEPSIMMRRLLNVPFQSDFNLKLGFLDDRLVTGLAYRAGLGGSLGLLLGTETNNFRLFYSYDVSFQRFQQYNSGAHEVTIAFKIPSKSKKPVIPGK